MSRVLILLGSTSDERAMQGCTEYLTKFEIPFEMKVSSAHRQPEQTASLVKGASTAGFSVIIASRSQTAMSYLLPSSWMRSSLVLRV